MEQCIERLKSDTNCMQFKDALYYDFGEQLQDQERKLQVCSKGGDEPATCHDIIKRECDGLPYGGEEGVKGDMCDDLYYLFECFTQQRTKRPDCNDYLKDQFERLQALRDVVDCYGP